MQEIIRINHIGIRVANLEQARKFYEKLGFVFIAGPIGPEPVAIMEHPSGININFILNANAGETDNILMDNPVKYPGYTHIALEVTDITSIQNALQEKVITITDGPISLPDGAVMLFIRDPDKNVIEFHQPRSQP
jgi:lactoylglutathione lyase